MDTTSLCQELASTLQARHWTMVTAESCTGGLIAARCTDLPGSSHWFDRGFVTYSNAAKSELLGVPAELIAQYGAVSQAVAIAMARGALAHSRAQASVAVTGVAGPSGGSPEKPVGMVWLAWCVGDELSSKVCRFSGDRASVRNATVQSAIAGLIERLK